MGTWDYEILARCVEQNSVCSFVGFSFHLSNVMGMTITVVAVGLRREK